MMKVWVMQGSYEAELFSSVHFTEKGCALACVADVLEFLGVDNEEEALRVMNDVYSYSETDGEQTEAFEWDQEKMKNMTSKELWKIFSDWTEISWDRMSDRSYYIDAQPMEIQA
tara:strand:- start:1104 stop:1445 length:342 start_codon:yes stop_codon:yes gene_type:complete